MPVPIYCGLCALLIEPNTMRVIAVTTKTSAHTNAGQRSSTFHAECWLVLAVAIEKLRRKAHIEKLRRKVHIEELQRKGEELHHKIHGGVLSAVD